MGDDNLVRLPKFSKKFSCKFPFHLTFIPEFLEFSVSWFAFRKFNNFQNFWNFPREISVPFFSPFRKFRKFWSNGKRPGSSASFHLKRTIALSRDKPRARETGLNYRQGEDVLSTDLPSRAKIMRSLSIRARSLSLKPGRRLNYNNG